MNEISVVTSPISAYATTSQTATRIPAGASRNFILFATACFSLHDKEWVKRIESYFLGLSM